MERVVISIVVNYNKYFDLSYNSMKRSHRREWRKKIYLQKGRLTFKGSGISPRGKSPKFLLVGVLENCKKLSFCETLKNEDTWLAARSAKKCVTHSYLLI